MSYRTETPFKCEIMLAEGIMQETLLMLPIPQDKDNLKYIRRYEYKDRAAKIETIKNINTVEDAFYFAQSIDITDFPIKKEKGKKDDVTQENINNKIRDTIFTCFILDALKERFGEENFKDSKFLVDKSDIGSNNEFDSEFFDVYNMINISGHIKQSNQITIPFLSINFCMMIEFSKDIMVDEFKNEIGNYLKLNKKLPISYTSPTGKVCKATLLDISTLGSIKKKERDQMRLFGSLIENENDYNHDEACARVVFYHKTRQFYYPLKTVKFSPGSNLVTMKNNYDSDKYDFHLSDKMLTMVNDYAQLKKIILSESKSFSLRTNKIEEFAMNKFRDMIDLKKVEATIYPENCYQMDRRVNKNATIDLFVIYDPHSQKCDFYDNIEELKPWQEAGIKINIHKVVVPLFMYNKLTSEDSIENMGINRDISNYIQERISEVIKKENIKNPVSWILWPKRVHHDSRDIFLKAYYDNDFDMDLAISTINYDSPKEYETLDYRIPKLFLEYDLLSFIPVQNTLEGYSDDTFKKANFVGLNLKMRNIAEGIITQSETLDQQLKFLHNNNIHEVDTIISWDVVRNMTKFEKRDMACYCCHILPLKDGKIIEEYSDSAISMAQLYDGGKEKRDTDEISDFYNLVRNKLAQYNININHKIIVRDGMLYEDLEDIKNIFGDNHIITQVKKSNMISYVEPNGFMDKYATTHNNTVIRQKDGKPRVPNRYIICIEPDTYKELNDNDFIFGASCKVMASNPHQNDRDNDSHCRSLHLATILSNVSTLSRHDIMMIISKTCASNTTTAEGLCMLPYAQRMADRIPYEFIKDGNMGSRLSRYVETNGINNAKQHILSEFNKMLMIYGSNIFV